MEDIKRIFSLLKRYFQLPFHFQNVYVCPTKNFRPKIFSVIFKLKWTMLLLTWPFLPSLLLDITIYIQHFFDHFDFSNTKLQNITLCLLNTQVCSGDLNFFFHFKTAGVVICMQIAEHFPFFRSYTLQCTCVNHNDPSKPSHRLTNGLEPSKTIESDGSCIKKPS